MMIARSRISLGLSWPILEIKRLTCGQEGPFGTLLWLYSLGASIAPAIFFAHKLAFAAYRKKDRRHETQIETVTRLHVRGRSEPRYTSTSLIDTLESLIWRWSNHVRIWRT